MYPNLFGQDFLDMYTIMIIIGVLACLLLFRFLTGKLGVDNKTYNFYLYVAVAAIIVGFISSFLFQQLYNYIDFVKDTNPKKVYEWKGYTFIGGLIGGAVTFIAGTLIFAKGKIRSDFWLIANIAAPCITIAHAFGRMGCFFAGCCYGIQSEHGVLFHGHRYKVLPTNLYEAIFLFLLTAALIAALIKLKDKKLIILMYAAVYSVFRFILEFYRGDNRGTFLPFLSPSQWQSILIFLVAAALFVLIYRFNIIPLQKSKRNLEPEIEAREKNDKS